MEPNEENVLGHGIDDEYEEEPSLTEILDANNMRWQDFMSPKGLAFKVFITNEKKQYEATIFCNRDENEIQSCQIMSDQPVDPEQYCEVEILFVTLTWKNRGFVWHLLENGHYVIKPSLGSHKSCEIQNIPATLKKMVKKFISFTPFIEDLAHGRKSSVTVHREMHALNLT